MDDSDEELVDVLADLVQGPVSRFLKGGSGGGSRGLHKGCV